MGIEKEEWNRFIDTGSITRETLVLIAKKIKTQQDLSNQEIAVYQTHHAIIELLLTQKFKSWNQPDT